MDIIHGALVVDARIIEVDIKTGTTAVGDPVIGMQARGQVTANSNAHVPNHADDIRVVPQGISGNSLLRGIPSRALLATLNAETVNSAVRLHATTIPCASQK